MRILVVATKSPWPPRDGGRLALWLTLRGLADAGHEVMLVAPVDNQAEAGSEADLSALRRVCIPQLVVATRRSWLMSVIDALVNRRAVTVARHRLSAVQAKISDRVTSWRPDILHVEQLQALGNCDAARCARVPVLLRMQNVESSLWHQVARARWQSRPLGWEARRLQRDEARALRSVNRVVALTVRDALALREAVDISQANRITAIAPPFPGALDAAEPLSGQPCVVLAGSSGWWPNREGTDWFVDHVHPLLMAALPNAQVHIFGGSERAVSGVKVHAAPDDAIAAFPNDAIAAIALHIGSGIRMRILEAWARGLPVVATSTAAAGLQVQSGRELLIADSAEDFAAAIRRVAEYKALRQALIDGGRDYLSRHHDSAVQTAALVQQYEAAMR
jgi:polysaccharide biosynthesis protein PslH